MLSIEAFQDPSFKFTPQEFVHPAIIQSVGLTRCLYYISDFQINYAALLREVLNTPVILNTYSYKKPGPGYYVGRGTRPSFYRPEGGGTLSQHYLANALDASTKLYSPHEIFEAIMANEARFKVIGLTTIEDPDSTPGWIHGDCRRFIEGIHPESGFLIVRPI